MTTGTQTSRRILIVGGGVVGLSIASRLAESGLPVTILEAAHLGHGASSQNQGWLHSGAWFARVDRELARWCHESLQSTLRFHPDIVEPAIEPMAFLISKPDTLPHPYLQAWREAEIPFSDWPLDDLFARLPGLDRSQVQHAYKMPDRAFRPDILLEYLAGQAQNAGAEILSGVRVDSLLIDHETVQGVVTTSGQELRARLVILAGNIDNLRLAPSNSNKEVPLDQPEFQPVILKTHLISVQEDLGRVPFCVLDAEGFSYLPHPPYSVFGFDRLRVVGNPDDREIVPGDIEALKSSLTRFFPGRDWSHSNMTQWAGATVQAMRCDQVLPGQAPLPILMNHFQTTPRVDNLYSAFPGRASLWPQLAEACRREVLEKLGARETSVDSPRWSSG